MRPGSSTMLDLQYTLLLGVFFACSLQLSFADNQEPRKAVLESGSRIGGDFERLQKEILSHRFRRDDQMTKDAGLQRPHGQHPPAQLIDNAGPHRSGKLDDLGRKPQIDRGPHRPSGQDPPIDNIRLTPLEILSGRKLGQPLSNPNRRDIDIGPQRRRGQDSIRDIGSKRPSGQSSFDESVSTGKLIYPGRQTSVDLSGNSVTAKQTSKMAFSRNQRWTYLDRDIGPNRQFPPSIDLGPQRPNGQIPPKATAKDLFVFSNSFDGQRLERFRRDLDRQNPSVQMLLNDERVFPFSAETSLEDDSTDNDIEVSPYAKILKSDTSDSSSQGNDSNNINSRNPQDHGPHRPMGSVDPNGVHSPPDLGPQRPSGPTDPNGLPSLPSDLGPQRPSGQHPPSESKSQVPLLLKNPPSDLGPHRPSGTKDPNGVQNISTDLGPQRPSSQLPPVESGSQKLVLQSLPSDLGPHGPSGNIEPNGVPLPLVDLGSQRPAGQHQPPEDAGPHRHFGQHPRPEDLGSQRPAGQKVVLANPLEDESQKIAQFRSPPSDLTSQRPSGTTDPNGLPSSPADLGPQRPSGQNFPLQDLGLQRPTGQHPPPEDLGPQRPSGQHPIHEDLGRQRPSGQRPPRSAHKIVLSDPLENASEKGAVSKSTPSDVGPHRPSGMTDPNGLPMPPTDLGQQRPFGQHPPSQDLGPQKPSGQHLPPEDLGPQRPSGQHPPPEDLGRQRPSGQHPPRTTQKMVLADYLENESEKVVVSRSTPKDLGPHRPSGMTDPNGLPTPPTYLGPQRPSGQHPPPQDLGPQRPSGQHPPPEELGPQRPTGQHPPPEDLGRQWPSEQHPPRTTQKMVLADYLENESGKVVVSRSTPKDLGPHRPSGMKDPNGLPMPPTYLGPRRPSGQHPPPQDLGPQRPSGQHPPSEDLGPQRPSGQHPQVTAQMFVLPDHVKVASVALNIHSPPSNLVPYRPSEATDPNRIHAPPSDLGPHRPSGQHPPQQEDPLRLESIIPLPTIDLSPHRPAGPLDPNIKPGIENDQEQSSYNVYWNIPTFMCHKHGHLFRNLSGEYGVVQNPDDAFRGPRITILYDPGLFPAVLQDEKGYKFLRNGGVPQEGDIQKHLAALEDSIEEQVPKDFDGLGVIDFEAWRPVWAQNWGTLNIYRTVSINLEKRRDPTATRRALEIRAKARFEAAARVFFEATIQLAQQLRPQGRWGFYGFPHCFNQVPARTGDYSCATQHQHQNDKIDWLWKASTALYPSVYLTKANKTAQDELAFVSGRLAEAKRVSKGVPVYAYVWYRYHDTASFLTEDDLWSSVSEPRRLNLAGTILWGSSSDLNSSDKCARFSQVLQTSIGPAVVRATGRRVRKTLPTVIFATRR